MWCSSCKQEKLDTEFHKNRSRKSGLQSHCKECFSKRYNNYSPLKRRKQHLQLEYNLIWFDYLKLYNDQKGQCAICKSPIRLMGEPGRKTMAHVDHDHRTGIIRELLCHNCNAGIGYLGDSPERLEIAKNYLIKHIEFQNEVSDALYEEWKTGLRNREPEVQLTPPDEETESSPEQSSSGLGEGDGPQHNNGRGSRSPIEQGREKYPFEPESAQPPLESFISAK